MDEEPEPTPSPKSKTTPEYYKTRKIARELKIKEEVLQDILKIAMIKLAQSDQMQTLANVYYEFEGDRL